MAYKVTFTLDDETVRSIRRLAEQARKPQSLIVREAVACYAGREDLLTDDERQQTLAVLRELGEQLPQRPREDVERELSALRDSRQTGWQRPSDQ